jgi:hypothetical protein
MFGPEGFGGIRGDSGEITGTGGAKVAIIARWQIRRVGSQPGDKTKPMLQFRAHFSWKQDTLMKMCQTGQMKGRVRVFMSGRAGERPQQVDVVQWSEWKVNEDGVLILEDVLHFDTQPLRS